MIRSKHVFYDVRQQLVNPKFLIGLLAVALFFVLYVSFQLLYVFALLFAVILAARGLIGRRCPHCDKPLKETESIRDKENSFILYVIWQCPRDGYEEKEKVKGDSGLFGVN